MEAVSSFPIDTNMINITFISRFSLQLSMKGDYRYCISVLQLKRHSM